MSESIQIGQCVGKILFRRMPVTISILSVMPYAFGIFHWVLKGKQNNREIVRASESMMSISYSPIIMKQNSEGWEFIQ